MSNRLSREFCDPKAGQHFVVDGNDYVLGGEIGNGATSVVHKATRKRDNYLRAVKFLAPDPKYINEEAFDDVASRFKREGERGAQLNYLHLIAIDSYNENANGNSFEANAVQNPFLLMEYVQGRTLERYIQKFSSKEVAFSITQERLHIAIQVARAVEDLHKQKLIHRDIKPANIFLWKSSGHGGFPLVKLGDFGVVKWGDFYSSLSTGTLTATHQKGLGTLKYMSPEQAIRPKEVALSSDVFSLGITLFELFTGQILASSHHVTEVMLARLARGTTASRCQAMGYRISTDDDHIAEVLLDMHLRGATGRPKVSDIRGRLEYEYERRYGTDWKEDIDAQTYG